MRASVWLGGSSMQVEKTENFFFNLGNPLMLVCAHLFFGPISPETSSPLPEDIHVAASLAETEQKGTCNVERGAG